MEPEVHYLPSWRKDQCWVIFAKPKGRHGGIRFLGFSVGASRSQEEALSRIRKRVLADPQFRAEYSGWQFVAAEVSEVLELDNGLVHVHRNEREWVSK